LDELLTVSKRDYVDILHTLREGNDMDQARQSVFVQKVTAGVSDDAIPA
jgi:hypothetical protein